MKEAISSNTGWYNYHMDFNSKPFYNYYNELNGTLQKKEVCL